MDELSAGLMNAETLNTPELLINLLVCIVASFILRAVYVRKSISLSGKFHIGIVIPLLAIVVFLVITIVKSSLALSLGLVGALSIVRFRTPIKEPEELVYLFIAISLGLGYGANQTFITSLVFVILMILILFWLSRKSNTFETDYNMLVDFTNTEVPISQILDSVKEHAISMDIKNYNFCGEDTSVFLAVNFDNCEAMENLSTKLKELHPKISCSFYHGRQLQ